MTGGLNTVINEVVVLGGSVSVVVFVVGGKVSVVGGSVSVMVLGGRVSVVVAHAAWRGVKGFACPSRERRERRRRYRSCIVRVDWVVKACRRCFWDWRGECVNLAWLMGRM